MDVNDIGYLAEQNPWWIHPSGIQKDINIRKLKKLEYVWDPNLKYYLNLDQDVIYTVRGPRQVGKTTMLKIIIRDLLTVKKVIPEDIFYWSFERNTADELHMIIDTYLKWREPLSKGRKYIFLDEVCSIRDWVREIIYFANRGRFENCSVLITGSHSMDMKYSSDLMPGRRSGSGEETLNKILLPMKFSEYVFLLRPDIKMKFQQWGLLKNEKRDETIFGLFTGKIPDAINDISIIRNDLDSLFDHYLLTGGIPQVINEYWKSGRISTRTFDIYLSAMLGDLNRYRYKELYFKQIVKEAIRTMTTPISWNEFTVNTEISSHDTARKYIEAMEELYIANIAYRYRRDKRTVNTTANKKLYFQDPFLMNALDGWSRAAADYFSNAKSNVLDVVFKSRMVESIAHSHLCKLAYRLNPQDHFDPKMVVTYYRDKKNREIDFLLLEKNEEFPFEVKYQGSVSKADFRNFYSFGRGVLLTKGDSRVQRNYVSIPVSVFLMLI